MIFNVLKLKLSPHVLLWTLYLKEIMSRTDYFFRRLFKSTMFYIFTRFFFSEIRFLSFFVFHDSILAWIFDVWRLSSSVRWAQHLFLVTHNIPMHRAFFPGLTGVGWGVDGAETLCNNLLSTLTASPQSDRNTYFVNKSLGPIHESWE